MCPYLCRTSNIELSICVQPKRQIQMVATIAMLLTLLKLLTNTNYKNRHALKAGHLCGFISNILDVHYIIPLRYKKQVTATAAGMTVMMMYVIQTRVSELTLNGSVGRLLLDDCC